MPDQRPLSDPAEVDRLRIAIIRLSRRIRATSPDNITASQLSTLGTILKYGPVGIGAIAEHEHVRPPSASKIVTSLERQGYIERRTDPNDRRCQQIVATPHGEQLAAEFRSAGRGWVAQQLAHLSDDEIEAIDRALPALERLLGAQ